MKNCFDEVQLNLSPAQGCEYDLFPRRPAAEPEGTHATDVP